MLKVSNVLPRGFSVKLKKYGYFQKLVLQETSVLSLEHPKHISYKTKTVYMQEDSISFQSEDLTSSFKCFYLQVRIQCAKLVPRFLKHLILLPM